MYSRINLMICFDFIAFVAFYLIKIMEFNFADKKLILEALEAYKDTDNDEYNIEINDLINKIQNN